MTKITFFKKNNLTVGFRAEGHTGFAEEGNDIVCSAISTATQMTIVGLQDVLGLKISLKKDDRNALLECKLASKESEIEKAQSFFKALEISLKEIEQDYKKYMKVEVKDEIV